MTCENKEKAREYKNLLSKIRPLIQELDKSKDVQLCLLWLSKLDRCSRFEESERNEILSELSRQVKNKSLEPPFNDQPPPGPLKNIVLHNSVPLWRSNDFCDDISSEMTSETKSPASTFSTFTCYGDDCESPVAEWMENPAELANSPTTVEDHSRCRALQQKYQARVANDQLLITRYQDIIKSLITQRLKNPAGMKLKSLKSTYERKISDLKACLNLLEDENKSLKEKLMFDVIPVEKLQETLLRNSELEEEVKRLELENTALDIKCRDLESEKHSCLSSLEERLKSETEKKLNEKDDLIKTIEKKYEENFRNCKIEHEKEVNEVKKKFLCELSELEKILEEKDGEIARLVNQCRHFEEQILNLKHDCFDNYDLDKQRRKVKFLKNKLKTLSKNQENLAVTFQSQLEHIVSKKDLLISTLEMKVKSTDVDNSTNNLYPSFDDVVSEKVKLLEAQYRTLLEEAENQAAQRRQLDFQKILTLEKQLLENGVRIEDSNPACVNLNENQQLIEPVENIELIACKSDNK